MNHRTSGAPQVRALADRYGGATAASSRGSASPTRNVNVQPAYVSEHPATRRPVRKKEGFLKKIPVSRTLGSGRRWVWLQGDGILRYSDNRSETQAKEVKLGGALVSITRDGAKLYFQVTGPEMREEGFTFCAEDGDRNPAALIEGWVAAVREEVGVATRGANSPPSSRRLMRGRSESMLTHADADAFDGLLEQYSRCVVRSMYDEVDAADVSSMVAKVREIADPSQLALSKLEMETGEAREASRQLSEIWNIFDADGDGVLNKEENLALVTAYFSGIQRKGESLLRAGLHRIFSLFCSDARNVDQYVKAQMDMLTQEGALQSHSRHFFSGLKPDIPRIAQQIWERMDVNKDGKVHRDEFMEHFLSAADMREVRDMQSAIAGVITDKVVERVLYGGPNALLQHKAGMCGLSNIGNTCYMNSALQCLSATTRFRQFFISGEYTSHVNKYNKLGTEGRLANKFGELLNELWSGRAQSVKPKDFKKVLGDCNDQFRGWAQEDSQELLSYLMDMLHEDLNRVTKKEYVEIKDRPGAPDWDVAEEYWLNHIRRNNSVIVSLFHGQLRSIVQCNRCRYEGKAFDPFSSLSLPVPSGGGTLRDCMNRFTAAEEVGGGNEWYCPRCKTHVPFHKDISLWRLPYYLIFHLKRFKYNMYGTISSKIDAQVDFPEVFDPTPWLAPGRHLAEGILDHVRAPGATGPAGPAASAGPEFPRAMSPPPQCAFSPKLRAERSAHLPGAPSTGSDDFPRAALSSPTFGSPTQREPRAPAGEYHLYGIINHYGSISGGHYTAYCKVADKWNCFDDSFVSLMSERDLRKAQQSGYVLFYKLR
eukprot:Hpha_TRINITY_DN14506_c0_g1::TRINITY_DN14506_c0_g1_i1::g.47009::m.47009/K11839/USP8, UBP5; ubiquitin carboxyl-terminal hydrolase 8